MLVSASLLYLATILPESIGGFSRAEAAPAPILNATDRGIFQEYGLLASERAAYRGFAGRAMTVEAMRFAESTGSHAAYLWLRPAEAAISPLASHVQLRGIPTTIRASRSGDTTLAQCRNYVFRFHGATPSFVDFEALFNGLESVDGIGATAAP